MHILNQQIHRHNKISRPPQKKGEQKAERKGKINENHQAKIYISLPDSNPSSPPSPCTSLSLSVSQTLPFLSGNRGGNDPPPPPLAFLTCAQMGTFTIGLILMLLDLVLSNPFLILCT